MEKSTLIKEIMWEYNTTKANAEKLVEKYESSGKYKTLCELIKVRDSLSTVGKNHV